MAQNKDLKTAAQLKREYNKLLKSQLDMEAKLLRYQQEGVDLTADEKREFIDLKKATEDAGKAAKKAADGRTKAGKKSKKAAEEYAASLENKLGKALKDIDKKTGGLYQTSSDAFGGLVDLAEEYSNSSKKGADKAAELIETIVDLQTEVIEAGAGFKNLSDDQAEALNKKIKEIEKTADDTFKGAFKKGADRSKDIFKGMKGTAKAGKGFKHHATKFADKMDISLKKADLLAAAVAAVGAAIKDAAEQAEKFQQSIGVSNRLARQQIFNWKNIGLSFLGLNDDFTDVNTQLGLASNNLDIATGKSKSLSNNMAFIARDTGASAQTLASVNQLFQNSAGLTAEQASQLQLGLVSMSEMAGVIPGQVLEDMATNAEMLAKFSDGTAEGMARAAIQAQKLGINLSKAGQIADSLLNLESSIASEFEASVLIGRDLNFDRARNLALNNDIEGAMKDIVDQLGSEEEFNKLNAIQRQALADSIGVGVEDLAAMVTRGGEGAADLDIGVKLQKQSNKTLMDILKQIGPGMISTITGAITAGIVGLLAMTGLKKFFEKTFPKQWGKMTGFFGKVWSKIAGKSSIFGKALSKVGKWFPKLFNVFKILGKGLGYLIAPLIDLAQMLFGSKDTKESGAASMGFGLAGAGIGAIFGGPLGAAIGYGIGSLVGMITNEFFPKIGEAFWGFAEKVAAKFKDIWAGITGIVTGITDTVSGFAENAKTFVSDKFDAAQQKMKNAKESVKRKMLDAAALARDVGTKAKEALSGAWDAVSTKLSGFFGNIGTGAINKAQLLWDRVGEVTAKVSGFFSNIVTSVLDTVSGLWDSVSEKFTELKDSIIASVTAMFDFSLSDAASAAWDAIPNPMDLFSSDTTEDYISRPGQKLQKFAATDTVIGLKNPGILKALGSDASLGETGTRQVALLQALVTQQHQMGLNTITAISKVETAVSKIGVSKGA